MRAATSIAACVLAASLAGCVEDMETYRDRVRGEIERPTDYVAFFEDFVMPAHDVRYPFPVEDGAVAVVAEIILTTDPDTPLPIETPLAQITVDFRAPDGGPIGETATLNPSSPADVIRVAEGLTAGEHNLAVVGQGLSGNGSGAKYAITLVVSYQS